MKYKLLALILGLTIIITGCGTSSNDAATPEEGFVQENVQEQDFDSFDTKSDGIINNNLTETSAESDMPRKLVKNSRMDMETKEFDDAIPYIINLVEEKGGYIQNQSVNGSSLYDKGSRFCRNASITARIPAEHLEDTQKQLSSMFNITSKNDYIDDITDNYYDVMARLNTLKAQETKLLELLEKAQNLTDVIELEKALADCRAEIDSVTGRIKRMDNQVAYSTVNMNIYEVIEYKDINSAPMTFGERVKQSVGIGMNQLKNFFTGIFFFALEDLPVLLVQLVIFGGIIWLIVWIIKKIQKKMPPKKYNGNYVNQENKKDAQNNNFEYHANTDYPEKNKKENKK